MSIIFNPFTSTFDFIGSASVTSWKDPVATTADLPGGALDGDARVVLASSHVYIYSTGSSQWKDTGLTVAAFSGSSSSTGITIDNNIVGSVNSPTISLHAADNTNPGAVSTTTQTFAGDKTFNGEVIAAKSGTGLAVTHDASIGGNTTVSGTVYTNTLDTTEVGGSDTLAIGTTNADIINIGSSGITVNVMGNTFYENVTNLQVADKNITVNVGGATGSGSISGISIEENAVVTGYAETSADRASWTLKAPATAGVATITPGSAGITLDQSSHDPVTLTAVGSSPNANAASLSSQALTLQPANVSNPGVLTAGAQTIGGNKTFNDLATFENIAQTFGMQLAPQNTSAMTLHVPQVATASGAGMALVQDETTGFIFGSGITSSIGGANSMMQLANATTANRAQIKLHSYVNAASVAGVSTLTSKSGVIAVNSAIAAGQDYSKWTAQAAATTPGSAPISGTWAFKSNSINSLTVPSDYYIQLTNVAGTLANRFYLSSEGLLQLPGYTTGFSKFDSSGNISSVTISPSDLPTGNLTDAGTDGITVTGGTNAVIGSGTSLSQHVADSTHNGYLASSDWVSFNNVASNSNANAGPSKVLYVDNQKPGTFTPDGSVLRPFTTISAALSQIITNADNSTKPYLILVGVGNYNETLSFNSASLYNITIASQAYSQGELNSCSFGPGSGTAITSTSNNTNLQNLAFYGFTINGDIILTGDINTTNFLGIAGVFVGCNIQKSTSGVLATNVNNLYFYDSAFNSTGAGPITFNNVAFALLEQGDGMKTGTTLNLVNNGGGNQPAQFSGNYMLMMRSSLSSTINVDAGSELDTVEGFMGATGTITMNGIWHAYGTIITKAIVLNNGSTFRNRGSFYSSTLTANAGSTVQNQGLLGYTPSTPTNWNTVPTEVFGALNTLATSGVVKSQTQNQVLASPNGSSGLPSFRALVSADIPAGAGITIAALDSQAANANGLALVGSALSTQSADATHPGMVNNTTQTLSGVKTFSSAPNLSSLTASLPLQLDGSKNIISQAIDLQSSQITNIPPQQIRIVAKNGNDSTGNGSWEKPYLTIKAAIASISDAAVTKNYVVWVMPGRYVEATGFVFKQNIHVMAQCQNDSGAIGPVRVTVSDASIPTTFTGAGAHQIILENITFSNTAGGTDFLFTADNTTTATCQLTVRKCTFPSASGSSVSVTSGSGGSVIANFDDFCILNGNLNVTGVGSNLNQVVLANNSRVEGTCTVTAGGILQINTGNLNGPINVTDSEFGASYASLGSTITLTGSASAVTSTLYQCFYNAISLVDSGPGVVASLSACTPGLTTILGDGTLSASGAGAQIYADSASLPTLSTNITLSGGATLIKITDAYSIKYTPTTAANWPVVPTSVQQGLDDLAALRSVGDISEKSFSLANNQSSAANVTGLAFANATVRSFEALVSVYINATSSLYEVFHLSGIQKGASWDMAATSNGDSSLVTFSITNAGQVQYTSGNYSGFSAGTAKFRAITTTV